MLLGWTQEVKAEFLSFHMTMHDCQSVPSHHVIGGIKQEVEREDDFDDDESSNKWHPKGNLSSAAEMAFFFFKYIDVTFECLAAVNVRDVMPWPLNLSFGRLPFSLFVFSPGEGIPPRPRQKVSLEAPNGITFELGPGPGPKC